MKRVKQTGSGAEERARPTMNPDPVRASGVAGCERLSDPGPGHMIQAPTPSAPPAARAIGREYGTFLGRYAWAHYVTLTTRFPVSPAALRAEFDRFVRRLERVAQGPVSWSYTTEGGSFAERVHAHALLGGTERVTTAAIERLWPSGNTRVQVYDPAGGAAEYVSKDVGREPDYHDISRRLPPLLADHLAKLRAS